MRCLILGGNGFIGSHLTDKLLSHDHQVRIFDKYEEHYRDPIHIVDYRYGDFGNRGLVAEALTNIDIVFHFINTTVPKTSNDDPAFDVQSNVVETIYLLEQCVKRNVRKVVFASSGGTVYGVPAILPIPESSATHPLCSYGITKLMIEKYLSLFHQLYGLDYTVVRPSNPYGSRQNPFGIQGAISVFLGKAVKNEAIEIWGDGEVVRDYIYIDDLVEGIYRAAMMTTTSRVFNLGSGEGISLNAIVKCIGSVTGKDVHVNYLPKRAFDVKEISLDISLARRELSWAPNTPLATGIRLTLDFVRGCLLQAGETDDACSKPKRERHFRGK